MYFIHIVQLLKLEENNTFVCLGLSLAINTNFQLFQFHFIDFQGWSCHYNSLCGVVKYFEIPRNSYYLQMLLKIGVLKNFTIFTGKHLSEIPATLFKRDSNKSIFPRMLLAKFLRTAFFIEHLPLLLLDLKEHDY